MERRRKLERVTEERKRLEADLGKKALAEVHELPVNRHRVTHDTFIDNDHAGQEDDRGIPVELPPYGVSFLKPKQTPPDIAA